MIETPSVHNLNQESTVARPARAGALPLAFINRHLALTYCVALAFALRLGLAWIVEQTITPDGVRYAELGQHLIKGNFKDGLSANWSPLYSLLVGLSSLLFRDVESAGRLVSVVAGTLLVIVTHKQVATWYGKRVALVGAFLIALHPLLIYYSTAVLTESTYTLFFIWGVLTGWYALRDEKLRGNLAAGVIFGVCYLLKPESSGFLLMLVAMTLVKPVWSASRSLKTTIRNSLLLCAGFLLIAAPYLFYLRQQTGEWTISGKTSAHLWQGSRAAAGDFDPIQLPAVPDKSTAIAQLTKALRFEFELLNLIFPPVFMLLVGLALFRTSWTADRIAKELYLFAFVAATLAGYAITLPNVRFLMPLVPLFICWLAKGTVDFGEWFLATVASLKRARNLIPYFKSVIVPITAAVILISMLPLFVYLIRGDKWNDYAGQKRAAQWIKENDIGRVPVIMSRVPITAFYAKGRNVALNDQDYASLVEHARNEHVDYLVVNERDFRYMSLRTLLDTQSIHPGLRLAFEVGGSPGHKVLLYAVDKDASLSQ